MEALHSATRAALDAATHGIRGANPLVGAAVLWDDGTFTTGYHAGAGTPHAEPDALRNASPRSTAGATLVVTLEPCSHTGRTGPCTHTIIDAGITRAVIASRDPNPPASGGAQVLTEAGVEVIFLNDLGQSWAHELATRAHNLNARWFTAVTHDRPFITAKTAQSLDGCVAARDRTSQWITGSESRAHAHLTRARVDAIAVGTGTALADNPRLTARTGGFPQQPIPVIFGSTPLPDGSHLARNPRTLTYTEVGAGLRDLRRRGVSHLLVEGSPTLLAHFLQHDLVDELHVYTAPLLLGDGVRSPLSVDTLAHALKFVPDAPPEALGSDTFTRFMKEV
ncbi:bifunctional diaminohydroxyphosphoribosylaminopyrimidine deaminase/5-amino-6-(5-phosphoribosylamino)uracil reductase RibD [Brevibacterium paucivorans]|uniref:Riboflavin biosynthesis protein RibD n=1 Tax=Brevibacterium paucivorans TaxID=170994 RepID=A0A2N6VKJ4_9MICO|nr:bifunctional diaminohydroxyphosphoribosylaminopyrimidine deaminase/5-amino-6-(5-phosphoribosylamino)uracil reductase RibD [Brevibacterium paucivorans]PMD04619.1 bifunctional diaminohydroxyphosphoribosylaminopyrimidine deaminase/5-amino-6-(5-phosphoribosylamino)uracil reductase RibD [Brevibacterium paucivorans]